jgi:hypothetical protein
METTSKLDSVSTAAQQISDAVDGHEADLHVINSKVRFKDQS